MFNVGDKVVCINDRIEPEKLKEITKDFEHWVEKGEEYTVREILDNDGIVTGILLEEIINFPKRFPLLGHRLQEPAFGEFRFRKKQQVIKKLKTERVETITT